MNPSDTISNVATNWPIIVASISVIVVAIILVVSFFQKPTPEQIKQIREWCLYFVILAERELGSGTGKLKLRYVYDKFVERFEYLSKIITFEKFSSIVDEALEEMKELLKSNKKIQEFVGVIITEENDTKSDIKNDIKNDTEIVNTSANKAD